MDWKSEIEEAISDFVAAAGLARTDINRDDFDVEYLEAPHRPPSRLPKGKMAVYGFWHDGKWLKIGKSGPKSNARYASQHYSPGSSRSNLARSLMKDYPASETPDFSSNSVGDWIRNNTNRVNIILDAKHGPLLLSFLEAFLHLRLRSKLEKQVVMKRQDNNEGSSLFSMGNT